MTVEGTPAGDTGPGPVDPLVEVPLDTPAPISETEAEKQARTNEGVAKATGILALGNIISRVLGLLREITLANLFGASAAVDAFNVAVVVPKGLYDLLIGGHVNGAIIPVMSEITAKDGKAALWRLVSVLVSMLLAVLSLLVLILQAGAPLVVDLVGGGLDAPTQALATTLLRLTSPALIFMGLFAVLSSTLYALRDFTWPAFATAVFNGVVVLAMLLFTPPPQIQANLSGVQIDWAIARPDNGITAAAMGWLLGAVAYMLLQLPGLRGASLRLTLNWQHPAIRKIGLLYLPVMFSLVLDILVIRIFSYNLATEIMNDGGVTIMNLATTLIQFPQGLVATAISIAILPTLSRQAALFVESAEDRDAFKNTLGLGLRLAITLIIPAAVGLFVLATPIVALIFGHGAFTASDGEMTVQALRLYLLGLPFAAVDLLLVYAFYARQDTLTPALIGLFSLMVYMVVALLLAPTYGLFSLMIADSVKHVVHAAISGVIFNRRVGGLGEQNLLDTVLRTGAAAVGLALTGVALLFLIGDSLSGGTLTELVWVLVTGGVSGAVFLVLAYLLRLEELRWLVAIVRRRVGR